jgi:hypothetical protein
MYEGKNISILNSERKNICILKCELKEIFITFCDHTICLADVTCLKV